MTFLAEKFIPESLNDTDSVVQERFNEGGGYDATWEIYNDGIHINPFESKEQLESELCIMSCKGSGTIRSGRAFSGMGSEYDYEPLFIVNDSLYFSIVFDIL